MNNVASIGALEENYFSNNRETEKREESLSENKILVFTGESRQG